MPVWSLQRMSFGLGIWTALTCVAMAQETYQLRYKFEPGQVVRYAVTMRDEYSIQVAEEADNPLTEQASTKQYRVVSVNPDGSAVLELMLESAKLKMISAGETREFDSQQETADPAFQALRDLLGKPHVRVTAAANGQLTNPELLGSSPTKTKEISQSALDAFVTLPQEPVAIGTNWREEFEVSVRVTEKLSRQVKIQRVFTLAAVTENRASIQFETRILTPINDADQELQLVRRPTKGSLTLDLTRGLLVEKTTTLDNTVTNFGDVASTMTLKQLHTEKLLEVQVAANPAPAPLQ